MNSSNLNGILCIVLGAFFYATKAIFIKIGFRETSNDGLDLLFLRMLFSLPFYLGIAFYFHKKNAKQNVFKYTLSSKSSLLVVVSGFLGYYLSSFLDFKGLEYITVNLERLILFFYPSVVLIVGAIFYGKKISRIQILAILLCWIGIGIAYSSDSVVYAENHQFKGFLFVFFAAVCYGLYLVLAEQGIKKAGAAYFTSLNMCVASLMVILHYVVLRGFSSTFNMESKAYLMGFLIAIFSTVIPAFLIAEGIKRIGSATASIVGMIGPVLTIVLSISILGEKFTVFHLMGTFLVLIGVYLISRQKIKT